MDEPSNNALSDLENRCYTIQVKYTKNRGFKDLAFVETVIKSLIDKGFICINSLATRCAFTLIVT